MKNSEKHAEIILQCYLADGVCPITSKKIEQSSRTTDVNPPTVCTGDTEKLNNCNGGAA